MKSSKLMLLLLVFLVALPAVSSAAQKEQFKVSNGVNYEYHQETISSNSQAIHYMTVDLNDPHTTVDVSIPSPLNKLRPTTEQAKQYSALGQQVVGAVNGSFYWSGDQYGMPMYLIAYRDRLMNAGIISSASDQYVNKPYAFGIDQNGQGKIDTYDLELDFSHRGIHYPITSTDKARTSDNLILYTPLFPHKTTKTNELGIELVISNVEGGTALNFGETVTGTVTKVRTRGDKTESTIPTDGFVLSAHGEAMQIVKDIGVGEEISISANIDDKWKGSSFMLTSGPHLVMDGKVNLGMDETSERVRERAPRTAIAIDKTGQKVFMVTVDGRQPGYSQGMSLKEFAEYLVTIGADRALNLDGGGSTTMATRKPGDFNVSLFNRPSDPNNRERSVSTSLLAVSTAPVGVPTSIHAQLGKPGVYLKGTKGSVVVNHIMDNYYNPVTVNPTNLALSSPQGLITATGLNFTANKAGAGSIAVTTGNATTSIPFEVVESIASIQPTNTKVEVNTSETMKMAVKALDLKNREVIFDANLIEWSKTGEIGTISSDGLFTAAKAPATGTITAKLANQTVTIPVTVKGASGGVVQIDRMEDISNWTTTSVEGTSQLATNGAKEPAFEGNGALKLTYDFTNKPGTSAAYINAKELLKTGGKPVKIGARVFGDAGKTWLRGKIQDSQGTEYTINFTKENGLAWIGWNYVTADVPAAAVGDITLKQIYIAQPTAGLKTKGMIMVDDVKAIFNPEYKEGLFKDTGITYRAENEISSLVNQGVIAGYADGTFRPYEELTRQQGAILLARALNLPLDNVKDPGFSDMAASMTYYKEVAAVANAGIIRGKDNGTRFDPNGKLTRAEMAAILQRGFSLPPAEKNYFSDIKGSFAYDSINALAHNEITLGIGGGKFGPSQNISRADFSVFLYRAKLK